MTQHNSDWTSEMKEAHFNAKNFDYCASWDEGLECCIEKEWFKEYLKQIEAQAYERGMLHGARQMVQAAMSGMDEARHALNQPSNQTKDETLYP